MASGLKKILDEIREQPEGTRLLVFWLCMITATALIGFVGFRSSETRLVALINQPAVSTTPMIGEFAFVPRTNADSALAANTSTGGSAKNGSWFSSVAGTFRLLGASISEFLGGNNLDINSNTGTASDNTIETQARLPLSGNK